MDTKVMIVSSAKSNSPKRRPKIRLSGFWLNGIGFEYDSLVTVSYDSGILTFKAQEKGTETYIKLVKGLLKNKSGLLQVRYSKANKRDTPGFEVKGKWLEDLGFTTGSFIAVQYEYGIIKVKLVDLSRLDI